MVVYGNILGVVVRATLFCLRLDISIVIPDNRLLHGTVILDFDDLNVSRQTSYCLGKLRIVEHFHIQILCQVLQLSLIAAFDLRDSCFCVRLLALEPSL